MTSEMEVILNRIIDRKTVKTLTGNIEILYWNNGFISVGRLTLSPGFRSLTLDNNFLWNWTKTQSLVVSLIFGHFENSVPAIYQAEISKAIQERRTDYNVDENFPEEDRTIKDIRIRDLFKIKGGGVHPSWGSFIRPTRGRDSKLSLNFEGLTETHSKVVSTNC